MNLRTLQKHWDSLGLSDPMWSILSPPGKRNAWDAQEFFASGVEEINTALEYVESIHPLRSRKCALDFGCGVGRVTQALAWHFDQVYGVDISPSMIQHARNYNPYGDRCEYLVNETAELRRFADDRFDFIYSNITLQHMPARFTRRYIAEFVRVLAPTGVLLFQLSSRRMGRFGAVRSLSQRIYCAFNPRTPLIVMQGIPKAKVVGLITEQGGQVLDIVRDESAGPEWEGFRYLVKKKERQV